MKLEKLYEIEGDERLFNYRFEGYDIPMWAFIRYTIISSLYYKLFHVEEKVVPYDCYISQKELLKYYLKSALKTPFIHKQRDIMFLFYAGGDILNSDNKYKNRIYGDYFLAAKEKSVIIQSSFNHAYTTPSIDDNIRFCDMVNFLYNREASDVSAKDLKSIDSLMELIKEICPAELEDRVFASAKNSLLYAASRIAPMAKYYRKLYESFSPKAVILQCAHYLGGPTPVRTAVAKEMGIKTIELQHGILCNTNFVYNFGAAALKSGGFQKCLPDYLLLFGDYWGTDINTPAALVTAGNPNFYEKERRGAAVPEKSVLVLYNLPESPDKCLSDYAIELARQLPGHRITYRFHPNVKKSDKIMKKLNACAHLKNLKIDKNIDIYDSLYEHQYAVSESSTVLYEAACLGKKVYALKTEANQSFIDPNLFTIFETPAELISKIKNREGIILDEAAKESIFSGGFPETYLNFLKSIGV